MTKIRIELDNYQSGKDSLVVDAYEGSVYLDLSQVDDTPGDAVLTPEEARSIAAMLVAQADAVER